MVLQDNNRKNEHMKKLMLIALIFGSLASNAQQRMRNPALDSLRNEKDPQALEQRIAKLLAGSESDMRLVIQFYGDDNPAKADSVLQLAVKRFPKGQIAFIQAQNVLFVEPSGKKQEEMLLKMKRSFPDQVDLDMDYYSVAYAYATSEKDIAKVKENLEEIKSPSFKHAAIRLNAEAIMKYNLPAAEAMVRSEIDKVIKAGVPQIDTSNSQAAGRAAMERSSFFAFLNLYSVIMIKTGNYQEGLRYAKEAYEGSTNKSDELIGNYGFLLSKNGQHAEALPLLAKLVEEGKGNAQLKAALAESYSKVNPGKDVTSYLAEIEKNMVSRIEAEIGKTMINETAPNFSVKDINGKTVSLSDFKGKTIILDFWATWCGPCKKSFPAMQLAVTKYANDPNVKFLFIHTWERVSNPLTDARKYFKDNNYNFDLYMDTKDAVTKSNPAVTSFNVKGIPAKFVIDPNGNIRFKVTGFSGGDDAAAAELSAMIELSRSTAKS